MLRIRNDSGDFHVEVLAVTDMRGPAAVAQTLYRETDTSRDARLKAAEERKAMARLDLLPGKPAKRDRRRFDRFRGRD